MATETKPTVTGEIRTLSTANGGTALTTTSAFILFPEGVKELMMTPADFVTASVAKFQFCPYALVVKRSGTFAAANLTDYTSAAQDADTATTVVLSSLPLVGSNGFLYVGSYVPFRGVRVVVVSANGTASVLTGKYRKDDDTWTDVTVADGTDSGGATFAVTGNITWTVPTDWKRIKLIEADNSSTPITFIHVNTPEIYWMRFEVSATLDSSTTLSSLIALNRSTSYAELKTGQPYQTAMKVAPGGISALEALTNAGTANLIVMGATLNDDMQGNLP